MPVPHALLRRYLHMKLLVFITTLLIGAAAACGSAEGPAAPAGAAPVGGPQSISKVVLDGTPSPPAAAAENIIADFAFLHDGFRTQVAGESEVTSVPDQSGGGIVTVRLRNLSRPSGSTNSRATINFSRDFDNYIEIPTSAERMRLFLHRDGALRTEPDSGAFT